MLKFPHPNPQCLMECYFRIPAESLAVCVAIAFDGTRNASAARYLTEPHAEMTGDWDMK